MRQLGLISHLNNALPNLVSNTKASQHKILLYGQPTLSIMSRIKIRPLISLELVPIIIMEFTNYPYRLSLTGIMKYFYMKLSCDPTLPMLKYGPLPYITRLISRIICLILTAELPNWIFFHPPNSLLTKIYNAVMYLVVPPKFLIQSFRMEINSPSGAQVTVVVNIWECHPLTYQLLAAS